MALRNKSQPWPLPTCPQLLLLPSHSPGSGTHWPSDCSSFLLPFICVSGLLASYIRWLNSSPGGGLLLKWSSLGLPISVASPRGPGWVENMADIIMFLSPSSGRGHAWVGFASLWPLVTLSACAVDSLPFNKGKPSHTSVWSPSSNGQPARSYI